MRASSAMASGLALAFGADEVPAGGGGRDGGFLPAARQPDHVGGGRQATASTRSALERGRDRPPPLAR